MSWIFPFIFGIISTLVGIYYIKLNTKKKNEENNNNTISVYLNMFILNKKEVIERQITDKFKKRLLLGKVPICLSFFFP